MMTFSRTTSLQHMRVGATHNLREASHIRHAHMWRMSVAISWRTLDWSRYHLCGLRHLPCRC